MIKVRTSLYVGFLILVLVACQKKLMEEAAVETGTVDGITLTSAKVTASIIDLGAGINSHGHCYNTTGKPDIEDELTQLGPASETGVFSSDLAGLDPGSTYFVRAYVGSVKNHIYGDEISFNTLSGIASVETGAAIVNGPGTAICTGMVSDDGGSEILSRGICWGRSPDVNWQSNDGLEIVEGNLGTFVVEMKDLKPGEDYFARAFALTSVQLSYGSPVSFSTPGGEVSIGIPSITETKETTAIIQGHILEDGGYPVTERGFCWALNHYPTIQDNRKASGEGTGSFTFQIDGLNPGTTYYVRAYGVNETGVYYSQEREFSTQN